MSGCKEKIFVFGASGHAKVVIDVLEKQGSFEISCIMDDNKELRGTVFYNYPILGGREELLQNTGVPGKGIVAIGNNAVRCSIGQWLESHQYELISAVHPSAQIGREVDIGPGCVIMANAVVNSSSKIGKYVIVNTSATVDHDCTVGTGVHLAPGTVICGSVRIGELSFLGAGSTVIQNTIIGDNVMIGAGTTVCRDIPDESRVVRAR